MCTGMEILQVVATAFSAVQSINRGKEQQQFYDAQAAEQERRAAVERQNAEFQAAQADADAVAEREAGEVRASKTRKLGRSQQKEARAALAAAGVEVGAGTPLKIESAIGANAESDALQEILYGTRKGARLDQQAGLLRQYGAQTEAAGAASAGLSRQAGENAADKGTADAFGSVFSSGAKLLGDGWKRTAKAKTETYPLGDYPDVRIG